jgi:hypothetical protein
MRWFIFAVALFVVCFCTVFFGLRAVRQSVQNHMQGDYEDYCDGDMVWCGILQRGELEWSAQ